MDEAVRAYIDAISPTQRPLFDRLHRLVLDEHPDAELGISYAMPTFRVGEHRLHIGAWKNWVSLYGWRADDDGGFVSRHPALSNGKGTLKLRPADAASIPDDELRTLLRAALGR